MPDIELPLREAQITPRFEDFATARKNDDEIFDDIVYKQLENARASANNGPRFHYISHEKMDAELSASGLNDTISKKYGKSSVLLKDAFRGDNLSRCINKRSLKRAAKSRNLWHCASLTEGRSLLRLAAWIVSTVISLVSLFISFFSPGNIAFEVLQSHHLERLLLPLGILCCVISIFLLYKLSSDRNRMAFEALDEDIDSMPDTQFLAFLENFSAEDFRLSGLKSWQENVNIVCPLCIYTPRQQAVLKRYWMTTRNWELWWIFVEARLENSQYIVDKSDHYKRAFIYLRPLGLNVKRDIAKRLGRDVHDPGLRVYGVDYIESSKLHIGITSPDISLSQRLDNFVAREQSNFPVLQAVYLVAELSVKYRIDFTSGKYWENLFEYPSKSDKLVDLDRMVSKEYFFSGAENANANSLNSIRYKIPLILNEFSNDLESIAIMHMPQVQLSCFSQLCLIKALRCREYQNEGRVIAIAETLYYTMKDAETAPEPFCKRIWIDIFTEVLAYFKTIYYGCFSPAFLHMLINIYDKSNDKEIEKLFSRPVVLWTAKANLLLNNSTDVAEELAGQAIDVIYDHFRIAELAVRARRKMNLPARAGNVPESLGLLNLTELQRRRYFYALDALGESDVLTHYDLLYDIYCITAIKMQNIGYFVKSVFQKNLNARYGYGAASSCDTCLKTALHSIAGQLKTLYPDNRLVSQDLPALIDLIGKEEDKNVGDSLFYLAKWEAYGFVMGSFIACLGCHINRNLKNYRDIYLNMGSYLVRMVFLAAFESREESYHNNDFQYLIRILTECQDPCLAVLTHLAFLGQRPTPMLAKDQIAKYLAANKESFWQNLLRIQEKLKEDEIEEYMSYIVSLSFKTSQKEKTPLYIALREFLKEHYAHASFASILDELLGYYIDGHFSEGFLNCPFLGIIDELKSCSPNTVYLVYSNIKNNDKNFISYCPHLVDSLMKSDFVNASLELARYLFWEHEKNKCTDEYINVAKSFYDRCVSLFRSRYLIAESEGFINIYYNALKLLKKNYSEAPDCYDWIDINTIEGILVRLSENCQYLLEVAACTIFRERKWERYGLLVYLKYLLTNSLFLAIDERDYESLDELDKLTWLEKNIASIQPLIYTNDTIYVNRTYIALLDLFLTNEGNIQERKSELEILNRVATDVRKAVPIIFKDDKDRCERIQNMITDYSHAIMA